MRLTQPMLAATVKDLEKIRYPVLATPKIDGIRCVTLPASDSERTCLAVSRNFKPIPNHAVRRTLEENFPFHLDGELVAVSETGDILSFQETSSAIMSRDGEPEFVYMVFDIFSSQPYRSRMDDLKNIIFDLNGVVAKVLPLEIKRLDDLLEFEKQCLEEGYEGVMLRDPEGLYKCGRSTVREGGLLKLKRFVDTEAYVVAKVEQRENTNEKERDAFGYAKRSTRKEGRVAKGTLGALVCKPVSEGMPDLKDREYLLRNDHRLQAAVSEHPCLFSVGSGFDDVTRAKIWEDPNLIGRIIRVRSQPTGVLRKPRFPVFQGFRHEDDLS